MAFLAWAEPDSLGRGYDEAAPVLAKRLPSRRRLVSAIASRFTNRRFVYAFVAASVFGAKAVHVYCHISALAIFNIQRWGYGFVAQDFALLIMVRLAIEVQGFPGRAACSLRFLASAIASLLIAFVTLVCVVTITFFAVAGSEIHWRNVGVAGDAAGRALLLSGAVSLVLVLGALCITAAILQDFLYALGGVAADIVSWPLVLASRGRLRRVRVLPSHFTYDRIPQHDVEHCQETKQLQLNNDDRPATVWDSIRHWPWASMLWCLAYAIVAGGLLAQVILFSLRPNETALTFMSWTPPLLPFVEFKPSSVGTLGSLHLSGIRPNWDDRTALGLPTPLPWLPKDSIPAGFENWYNNETHYTAASDPLRISNLEDELLSALRDKLQDVSIRHIMFIVLESTRKDIFPIKEDGIHLERLRETWPDQQLPQEAMEHLRALTPTAKFLTGDFNDGLSLQTDKDKPRGGISFNDAYTTSTYTLKSLTATLCGVTPVVADFNVEYKHHIYNPCLPQILDAFNTLDHDDTSNFTSYKWKSSFMQTATLDFDNFGPLVREIGFPSASLIDAQYLRSDAAKFGPITLPDVNYFGFEEDPLEDYIRDAFSSATENNERVFLTHVTSTSHHPWALPGNEQHSKLANGLDDLSHYIDTIGYVDRWLAKILRILDEQSVAEETLIVLLGDHGVSLPENDKLATYYNTNVGGNHVPLVLSHPKLPPITIDDAVSSQQVLPTVVDLLIETGSLSESARQAARDLLRNYEGQSLVRPIRKSSSKTDGHAMDQASASAAVNNWQFTVTNPGRAMISVRDARQRSWRLVVPTIDNIEWRFSDLAKDRREAMGAVDFDFAEFLKRVEEVAGPKAVEWVEDAVFATRWWVEENNKRWRYGPYAA